MVALPPPSARKPFSQAVQLVTQLGTFKDLLAAWAGGSMQKVRQTDTT